MKESYVSSAVKGFILVSVSNGVTFGGKPHSDQVIGLEQPLVGSFIGSEMT